MLLGAIFPPLLICATFSDFAVAEGKKCKEDADCEPGFFCNSKVCRRDACTVSSQCDEGELCHYGDVKGKRRTACFPSNSVNIKNKNKFCSGGGSAVFNFGMQLATCDFTHTCPEGAVCNPIYGVCCTKLKTCPLPSKTMLNGKTGRPVMCQLKGGTLMQCPKDGYCEKLTGFCCHKVSDEERRKVSSGKESEEEKEFEKSKEKEEKEKEKEEKEKEEEEKEPETLEELISRKKISKKTKGISGESSKPWRGSSCKPNIGCDGNAACICSSKDKCRCECATEFGYTVASDGRTCQRVRRRLKEKCKSDLECSAAFSECATSGCRCRRGFQRDGEGGCKPINYQCVSKQPPLVADNAVITCNLRQQVTVRSLTVLGKRRFTRKVTPSSKIEINATENSLIETALGPADDSTNDTVSDSERDDCPENYYCVPVFDNPVKRGYYQGFCCPSPSEITPVCPVGQSHDSSAYPDYGCKDCPSDHYCHRDDVANVKEICCPKPCPSLEDIYMNGQCYSVAYYGDTCTMSAQCQYQKDSVVEDEFTTLTQMECQNSICACPAGFSFTDEICKRVMCTVGLKGEPSVDRFNNLLRCERSADCSQGHMCDPHTRVCCKGNNRCPKLYVETGELCTTDDACRGTTEMCHRTKKGKVKICCRLEEPNEYSAKQKNYWHNIISV